MSIASAGAFTAQHLRAHRRHRAGDLLDALAAHPQRHQEAAHLRGRHFARQHRVESRRGLGARQRRPGGDLGDQRLERFHGCPLAQCLFVALESGGQVKEIAQDAAAMLARDALRMELHAVDRALAGARPP